MLLNISTTHRPATDLGYLLHKHPDRWQSKEMSFGLAHVFYPVAAEEKCTATLLLEIDTTKLARTKEYSGDFPLAQYVNDRAYVASSFLSTAIAKVYGSALNGNCPNRPELVEQVLPLEVEIASLVVRGEAELVTRLFAPLGYDVQLEGAPLDANYPAWGQSPYYRLQLSGRQRLRDLLSHLYVLIPALDNRKHYYIGGSEVDKLLAKGETWLGDHPERELIVKRYLRYRREHTVAALGQLADEAANEEAEVVPAEALLEQTLSLHEQRHEQVVRALRESGAVSVIDLGCGSGKLLQRLLREGQFQRIVGMDISLRSLEMAKARLHWEDMAPRMRDRISLLHGALTYRDRRLEGFDAAVLSEVIEHIDPERLADVERVVFQYARPRTVIVTTPNREYNVLFEGMPADRLRHGDHRFEWTRAEFAAWCQKLQENYGYDFTISGIGPEDAQHGTPSQMAVLSVQGLPGF